jgi:hypothetical protein
MPQGIIPSTCTNTNQACWVDMMNNGYVNMLTSGGRLYGAYRYISPASGVLHHNLREIDSNTGKLLNGQGIPDGGVQAVWPWVRGRVNDTPIIFEQVSNSCYTYERNLISCNSF